MNRYFLPAVALLVFVTYTFAVAQSIVYKPLYDNSNFSKAINLSKPVDVIGGIEGVTPTGAATYTIPLQIPVGTNGVAPSVSLVYNSQSGNGVMGMGWNISGLSAIKRVSKDIYHDDKVEAVDYTLNDVYILDGNRMVLESGTYGVDGSTYRLEMDNFSRITALSQKGNGPGKFLVEAKDGSTMEYAYNADSKFFTDDNNHVMQWLLSRLKDVNGNYIDYIYETVDREIRLKEILYTGNSNAPLNPYNKIKFDYLDGRIDKNKFYESGYSMRTNSLLANISIYTNNNIIHRYALEYGSTDLKSYLIEIGLFSSSGSSINSTIFKYGQPSYSDILWHTTNVFVPQILGTQNGGIGTHYDLITGDYNGDGKADVLLSHLHYAGGDLYLVDTIYVLLNQGNGNFLKTFQQAISSPTIIKKDNKESTFFQASFHSSDFNGDGADDFVLITFGGTQANPNIGNISSIDIRLSDGSGYFPTQSSINYQLPTDAAGLINNEIAPSNFIHFGDFDGDKMIDFLLISKHSSYNQFRGYISYLGKNVLNRKIIPTQNFANPNNIPNALWSNLANMDDVFTVDFDGDGKNELMFVNPYDCVIATFTESGSSTEINKLYGGTYPTSNHKIWIADFNGDDKTDILTQKDISNTVRIIEKSLSTGTGFNATTISLGNGYDFVNSWTCGGGFCPASDYIEGERLGIGDFDGDGLSDIFHFNRGGYCISNNCTATNYITSELNFYLSKGDDLVTYTNLPFNNIGVDLFNFSIADMDGDGAMEILFKNNYAYNPNFLFYIDFAKNVTSPRLTSTLDGFNKKTQFYYYPINQNAYTQTEHLLYPLQTFTGSLHAINSIVKSGIGLSNVVNYSYENATVHKQGRGFLGFKKITSENTTKEIKIEDNYQVDGTKFIPYLYGSVTYATAPYFIITGTTLQVSTQNTINSKCFFQRINQQLKFDFTKSSYAITNNTYNIYGNITHSETNNNNQFFTVSDIQYSIANTIFPTKPSLVTTTLTRNGLSTITNATAYLYNAKGNVSKITYNNNKSYKKFSDFIYDVFGNVIQRKFSATNIPIAQYKINKDTFDSWGRFPIISVNPEGQIAKTTYHLVWGKPISSTGIDGISTAYQYDTDWGHLLKTTYKVGTSDAFEVNVAKNWDFQNGGLSKTTITTPNSPQRVAYYDILEREIKSQTQSENGALITSEKTYDYKGNLYTSNTPHLLSETPVTTTNFYDYLNRPLTSHTLIGNSYNVSSYVYTSSNGNSTVSFTDPSGIVSSTIADVTGVIVSSTDNGGTLTYQYDSRGNQLTVKKQGTTYLTNTYDNIGRKVSKTDPSAGTTSYSYDGFDRLVSQQDASGTTSYQYDNADRIITRTLTASGYPTENTSYEYFSNVNTGSVNQLKKIIHINNSVSIIEDYIYDVYGNFLRRDKNIGGKLFQQFYTYDKFDRVTSHQSTGQYLFYNYGTFGHLQTIDHQNGLAYFTGFTAGPSNGLGQLKSYDLANNKHTVNTYTNGILTKTSTPTVSIIETAYNFASGNMNSRTDLLKSRNETFTYDNLNRLTNSTVVNTNTNAILSQQPITYDGGAGATIGNITAKPEIGTGNYYSPYSADFAIRKASNLANTISSQQQDITYTPFHRIKSITENGFTQTFTYDANYDRVKSELTQNGTLISTRYYDGDYEETIASSGLVTKVGYIAGPEGLYAMNVWQIGTSGSIPFAHYYLYNDHLGSIVAVTNSNGTVANRQSFDAWGRQRNATDWGYNNITLNPAWLYRGYTGHETMPQFNLINMNGRLYDPLLGRMLSPDRYLMGGSQGYNRYSYGLNNPMRYVDPTGDFVYLLPHIGWSNSGGLDLGISVGIGFQGVASAGVTVGHQFKTNNTYASLGAGLGYGGLGIGAQVGWGTQSGLFGGAGVGFGSGGFATSLTSVGVSWSQSGGWGGNAFGFNFSAGDWNFDPSIGYSNGLVIQKEYQPAWLAYDGGGEWAQVAQDKGNSVIAMHPLQEVTVTATRSNHTFRNIAAGLGAATFIPQTVMDIAYAKGIRRTLNFGHQMSQAELRVMADARAGFRSVGAGMGVASGALTIADGYFNGFKPSHVLDLSVTGASFIPGVGWVIGGAYFVGDVVHTSYYGYSIGDRLNSAVR